MSDAGGSVMTEELATVLEDIHSLGYEDVDRTEGYDETVTVIISKNGV